MTVSSKFTLSYSLDDVQRRVFLDIQAHLHSSIGATEIDKNLVKSVILQTISALNSFDVIEHQALLNSCKPPREQLVELFSLISNRNQTDGAVIRVFIDLLLNLEGLEEFSNRIKHRICLKFGDLVKTVEEEIPPSQTTLSTSDSSQGLLCSPDTTLNIDESIVTSKNSKRNTIILIIIILFGFLALTVIMIWIKWPDILLLLNLAPGIIPAFANETEILNLDLNSTSSRESAYASEKVSKSKPEAVSSDSPKPLQPFPTVTPSSIQTNTTELFTLKIHKLRFHISSFEEYSPFMRNIPPNREVILSISLRFPLDWPQNDVSLINSFEISKLSLDGPLTVCSLVNILKQTPNIQHLHLKNTNNKLCGRNHGQLSLVKSIQDTVYLPVLEKIVIQDFTECHEVYETLATYIEEMRGLKGLVIYRGVVEDGNHFFIEKFISRAKTSLRYLMLPETNIVVTVPFLEVSNGMRLYKVNMLRIDSMATNETADIIPIGNKISKIFPNLKYLISEHGYMKWRNVSNILDHRNLTRLQIGIEVPEGHNQFSVSFLRKALPLLKAANITLNFFECNLSGIGSNNGRNSLLGWETVRDTLEVITVRSNCKLHADFTMTPVLLRKYREEKYTKQGSMYTFTYRLLDDRK